MANYDSTSIKRGFPRGPGVYTVKDSGVINIASNVTIGSGAPDNLRICYIPPNCYMSNFFVVFPQLESGGASALTFKLIDTLTTTTTYITTVNTTTAGGGGILSMNAALNGGTVIGDVVTWGAQYGNTARSIGASGMPVKVWVSGAILQFTCTTSAATTTGATALNVQYMVEWSPAFDMGV